MFVYYLALLFIIIHTLNAMKNIAVLSSTEMLFGKHSIETFECYFERHTFDSIANNGETCSETFFSTVFLLLKKLTLKLTLDSWSIMSEFVNGNKNEGCVFVLTSG